MNMNRQPRNIAASVRARLTNLARTEKRPVQWMLIRYMQERFLYRLAQSKYDDSFVLKGGLLLYGVHHIGDRPTIDIDPLGRHIATSDVTDVIREIVSVPLDVDDGVVFDPESVQAKRITGQTKYEGMRVLVDCYLELCLASRKCIVRRPKCAQANRRAWGLGLRTLPG